MPNNNNNENNNNSGGGGVGPGVLGMMQGAFNMLGAGQQHRRQKELMDIQFGNQQALNRQGHQLQMDMWNKTNYGAQLEHMKKAGLNPALMYGMSGGGGTTAGSQGGGSASGGNAVQMHPMDMANMALIDAERKLKEAQARELDSKTGVNEAQTKKIGAEFKNVGADTIKKIQETTNLKTLDEWNGLKRDIEMMKRDKHVTGSTFVDLLSQVGLNPIENEDDRLMLNGILTAYFGSNIVEKLSNVLPTRLVNMIMDWIGAPKLKK